MGKITGTYIPKATKNIIYDFFKKTKKLRSLHALAIDSNDLFDQKGKFFKEWDEKNKKLLENLTDNEILTTKFKSAVVEDILLSYSNSPLEIDEETNKKFGGLLALIYYTQRIQGHATKGHAIFNKNSNLKYLYKNFITYSKNNSAETSNSLGNLEKYIINDLFDGSDKGKYFQDENLNKEIASSIDFISDTFGEYLGIKNFSLYEKQFRQALIDSTVMWMDEISKTIKLYEQGNEKLNIDDDLETKLNYTYGDFIKNLDKKSERKRIYKKYYNIDLKFWKESQLFEGVYKSTIENLVDSPLFGLNFFKILNEGLRISKRNLRIHELKDILKGLYIGSKMDKFPGIREKIRANESFLKTTCGGGSCYSLNMNKLKESIEKSMFKHLYSEYKSNVKSNKNGKDLRFYLSKNSFIRDAKENNFKNMSLKLNRKKTELENKKKKIKKNSLIIKNREKIDNITNYENLIKNIFCKNYKGKSNSSKINTKYKSNFDLVIDEEIRKVQKSFSYNEYSKKEINALIKKRIVIGKKESNKGLHKPFPSKDLSVVSTYIREKKGYGVCDDAVMVLSGLRYGIGGFVGVVLEDAIDTFEKMSFIYNSHGKDETIGRGIILTHPWLKQAVTNDDLEKIIGLSAGRVNLSRNTECIETKDGFKEITEYNVSKIPGHCSERYFNLTSNAHKNIKNNFGVGKSALQNHLLFTLALIKTLDNSKTKQIKDLKTRVSKYVDLTVSLGYKKTKYKTFLNELINRLQVYEKKINYLDDSIKNLNSNDYKFNNDLIKICKKIKENKTKKDHAISFIPLSCYLLNIPKKIKEDFEINVSDFKLDITRMKRS